MSNIKSLFSLILFLIPVIIFSQGEANNWYFGNNAGLNFNTNPPSALTNGALSTSEGCSSISAPNGDLLFYTDGRTVWNRNHQPMPNANYSPATNFDGLNGDPSSTSSGLIVPHPTNPNLFFVFTLDEPHHNNAFAYPNQGPADPNGNPIDNYTDVSTHEVPIDDDGFNNGLNYSLIDMTLENGLGDVVTTDKNIQLVTYDETNPEHLKYKASEKITAVRGADCASIWIIVHFIDSFYAFKIDENGVNETPVISTTGPSLTLDNYRRAALGYMKASPNGTKILTANNTLNYNQNVPGNQDAGDGNVFLLDFDNESGTVSNPIELISDVNAYGVEFSSDSEKAYAVTNNQAIFQWDLTAENIPASQNLITSNIGLIGAIQLGPDGRIYVSRFNSPFLGIIENPQAEAESINVTPNGIDLQGRNAVLGLPPFIQSLFEDKIDIIDQGELFSTELSLCDNETYVLNYEDIEGATYTWSLEGEVISEATTSELVVSSPSDVTFPFEEVYSLEVDLNDGSCPLFGIARITFTELPEFENAILRECVLEGETTALFDLNEAATQFIEGTNLTTNNINIAYYLNSDDAENQVEEINNANNFLSSEDFQEITARIVVNDCVNYKTITLISGLLPTVNDDELIYYCEEDFPSTITLSTGIPEPEQSNYSYIWSTGESNEQIEVNLEGSYTVSVANIQTGCEITKTIQVIYSGIANFDFEVEDTTQENNRISVIVTPESLGDYEYAIEYPFDFQDEPVFKGLAPGVYDVFVKDKNGCGIQEKQVGLLGVRDFFTPNNDGTNDFWQLEGVIKADFRVESIQVFDRYGKLLSEFTLDSLGWDGTYNGEAMPSNDYWYLIKFSDGLILKGNFTLKR